MIAADDPLRDLKEKLIARHKKRLETFNETGRCDGSFVACANECQSVAELFGWRDVKEVMVQDARKIL